MTRIDWPAIVTGILDSGMKPKELQVALFDKGQHYTAAAIYAWQRGSEPGYSVGKALLEIAEEVTREKDAKAVGKGQSGARRRKRAGAG